MKSLSFLILAIVLTLTGTHARGPAVEDFVGIENQEPDVTPEGTHALFNFQEDVKSYQERPADQKSNVEIRKAPEAKPTTTATVPSSAWPLSAWFGALVILALPVVTWSLTMRHLKKDEAVADLPDNVTPLPTRTQKTDEDKIKKAS
ncbi:MAG: hypothetical protein ACLGG0_04690 [Bacteriovoracia bacterium]